MGILSKMFQRGGTQSTPITTTAGSPFRIGRPVIGFYCPEPGLVPQMQADKAALGSLFDEVREGTRDVPVCNVLCIYARIGQDGSVANAPKRLRDIVRSARAHVAIVACANDPQHLIHSVEPANGWTANIVLTIDRKEDAFTRFFAQLFRAMRGGKSMLVSWVELAPQIPGESHDKCPETMMLAEAGHISFGGSGTLVQ